MALDLGKQVGPLPLGAWVVVVGGGLYLAYTANRTSASTDPELVDDTSTTPGVGEGPGWVAVPPPTDAPPGAAPITTNEEWGQRAIDYLIANNYPPDVAYSAITKALEGGQGQFKMSVKEYAMWRAALRALGTPPIPIFVPPPTTIPTPTPAPPTPRDPPRPHVRYHTIKTGQTLFGISNRYYGRKDLWSALRRANVAGQKRSDGSNGFIPNTIKGDARLNRWVGRRLIIPTFR